MGEGKGEEKEILIECLLCLRHHSKCCAYITSLNSHNTHESALFLLSFYN